MSDYELMYLTLVAQDNLTNVFMSYASLVFAYVAAGFFGAQILNRANAILLTVVYSMVGLSVGISAQKTCADFFAFMLQVKGRALSGSDTLAWHPVQNTPDFFLQAMPSLMGMAIFLAYAGSVYFFFSQRKSATPKAAPQS